MFALLIALTAVDAAAQEVFRNAVGLFPGPNPTPGDLLPDAEVAPERIFHIGQVIFSYPYEELAEHPAATSDLSRLEAVDVIVERAEPDRALRELIKRQLEVEHELHFLHAAVSNEGHTGLLWSVTWELFPAVGGSTGVPYRYTAVVPTGKSPVDPEITVFDAYLRSTASAEHGYICSTLRIDPPPDEEPAKALTDAQIRERATEALSEALSGSGRAPGPDAANTPEPPAMSFYSQTTERLPVRVDEAGNIIYRAIRAVNFVSSARVLDKERPDVFTVWVTKSGRVGEVRTLTTAEILDMW